MIWRTRPVVYCIKCGLYDSKKCKGLKDKCPEKMDTRGPWVSRIAVEGRHPTKKDILACQTWNLQDIKTR